MGLLGFLKRLFGRGDWRREVRPGNLGVDELAGKVKRVTELLKICRDRLHKTEAQIDKILDGEEGTVDGEK